jgi:hypothetical protein
MLRNTVSKQTLYACDVDEPELTQRINTLREELARLREMDKRVWQSRSRWSADARKMTNRRHERLKQIMLELSSLVRKRAL